MSVSIVTAPPASRLTTLDAVLTAYPAGTAGLPLVDMLITHASAAIASYTHRVWGHGTVTELLPGTNTPYLGLTWAPLTAVGTVTEDAMAITDWTVDNADAGRLYRQAGWGRGVERGWEPLSFESGYILGDVQRPDWVLPRYAVTYAAGYVLPEEAGPVTLPGDVQQAAIETVKFWYQQQNRDWTVTAKRVGDVSLSYGAGAPPLLPPLAEALLRPWRRVPFQMGG